ncbi:MAG: hypothetical protein EOQ64_15365 [Mesorhizobium sp.]|uniref:hypothetical protein n=1 Tax=Mesorhizobium sp. TaxID=1871066 RepID=UPI000FE951CD|nr:hypothetical protein [Mesorhizobium sp.]RWG55845.1 MAG: hypothetical protein EOQ64_15365 [Mesorhizobium sp.]RWH44966.1 MAG: hypothetical protein EOQ78_08530 [Mesorhizobium sp.]RWI26149.1 MAG: hypothetical protein EOQ94_11345 [Mesorhizobium sp.]
MSPDERSAVAAAFVALKLLHDNALTPAAKRVAARGAGNCLHALGLAQHGNIVACPPEGMTIDAEADQRKLT